MARDRLAQIKGSQSPYQQQQQSSYPTTQTPSAPQPSSYSVQQPTGLPSGPRSNNTTGGFQQPPQSYSQPQSYQDNAAPTYGFQQPQPQDNEQKFFTDIADIRQATNELQTNVSRIADLHQRQLDTLSNDPQHDQITTSLSNLTQDTRQLANSLKSAIKRLESQTAKLGAADPNNNVRRTQTGAVKQKFQQTIQEYQRVEQEARKKHRQKMERQFKIVKPDATQEEVNAALSDANGSANVFQQALLNSNRYGDARQAYTEVQNRHVEIVKIEQTITELAQMFTDMATMVEEQDAGIIAVEAKGEEARTDMEKAQVEMQKATKSARAARKKRWICFVIIVIILAIIGIVLGVHFGNK